jgi:hypothetical protein
VWEIEHAKGVFVLTFVGNLINLGIELSRQTFVSGADSLKISAKGSFTYG